MKYPKHKTLTPKLIQRRAYACRDEMNRQASRVPAGELRSALLAIGQRALRYVPRWITWNA